MYLTFFRVCNDDPYFLDTTHDSVVLTTISFMACRVLLRTLWTARPVKISYTSRRYLSQEYQDLINKNRVTVFSKSTCPFCQRVKQIFSSINEPVTAVEFDAIHDGHFIQEQLSKRTGLKTVPQVFVKGNFIGGCDDTIAALDSGKLRDLLKDHQHDYDLIVIGGGSGGLSASKEAARLGRKVALFDFVEASPQGTSWGIGGTCVNVGCIPKKLMHQAALLGEAMKDSHDFGWRLKNNQETSIRENVSHNWEAMVEKVQSHIKMANFNYRVNLREKKVNYINAYAKFIDKNTIEARDKKGVVKKYSADKFIIATGERPRFPSDVQGLEYAISSDDLFSLSYPPGKTVVVGASYVALECAGFLNGLGFDVSVLVRSILLRGFDQDIAERIGRNMIEEGITFVRPTIPTKIEQLEAGSPGKMRVHFKKTESNTQDYIDCNTVLFAIGRHPCTSNIGLQSIGVKVDAKSGKIPVNEREETNISNIYAVGDILQNRPELTPVAIEAGKLLARRLFGGDNLMTDYSNIPTTVFTPVEYACVGLSEEEAIAKHGSESIEVYHQNFRPYEWGLTQRDVNACFVKVVVLKAGPSENVIGIHFLGPNAGEVMQFASLSLKKGFTKKELDRMIGIHPTSAENFNSVNISKSSGEDPSQVANCCG